MQKRQKVPLDPDEREKRLGPDKKPPLTWDDEQETQSSKTDEYFRQDIHWANRVDDDARVLAQLKAREKAMAKVDKEAQRKRRADEEQRRADAEAQRQADEEQRRADEDMSIDEEKSTMTAGQHVDDGRRFITGEAWVFLH